MKNENHARLQRHLLERFDAVLRALALGGLVGEPQVTVISEKITSRGSQRKRVLPTAYSDGRNESDINSLTVTIKQRRPRCCCFDTTCAYQNIYAQNAHIVTSSAGC